jgi:nitrate reductase beta subunit
MRIRAQVAMVMNLDKCIGCHTCSVTCKQTWTNREGTEYVWFNNVETKPGIGYPKHYEDQERWKGGWKLDAKGRLVLRGGGRAKRLTRIFANPDLPTIDDYYEPATFDKDILVNAPAGLKDTPVKQPYSKLTGEPMAITWGANWEDSLGGDTFDQDPNLKNLTEKVQFEFEKTFMFHLPRICEHCLNPACVSACPSGAMYKREEDGIVLVDQDRCRGWRMCVSSTTPPARPRSAPSASPASRRDNPPSAARRASAASATWAFSGTTKTPSSPPRRCPTTNCSTPSARCSSTRTTRPCSGPPATPGTPTSGSRRPRPPRSGS